MVNLSELSLEEIRDLEFNCTCGQYHGVSIGRILIGVGVLAQLPNILEPYKGKRILLVADKNTYGVAGDRVFKEIPDGFIIKTFIYEEEHLVADAKALGEFLMEIDDDISFILTLGSGTLTDITRYMSAKTRIPYAIVATAPSMDGYASIVSPLIQKGVKTTFQGVYPTAIIGDTDIMGKAPMHMLQAGLGDVLGKYIGLADWRMSKIMGLERNEPYCENIVDLVENNVEICVKAAPGLKGRSQKAIEAIMKCLTISGICIGLAGFSRPASGSEHQIAHFIEMIFLQEGISTKWLHGNKVGITTLAVLEAYEYLFSMDIEDILETGKYRTFDKETWTDRVKRCYGDLAEQIIDFKQKELIVDTEERHDRAKEIAKRWDQIRTQCYLTLPSPKAIKELLEATGSIYSPKELGLEREMFKDSLMVAKEIRNRYGIMQLLDDLGFLEDAAEHIAGKYYDNNGR